MPQDANFSSVKLPAHLVSQARAAAAPMRRSVAGQIEYWATLGRIAEESGLTVHEAREAIASYDAKRQDAATAPATADPVAAIEAAFLQAETQGTLAQAVRKTVQSAYFSPSWTAFQADGGRGFNVVVDGVSV